MKSQEERSEKSISMQPKNLENGRVQMIMMYDILGKGTSEIADLVGLEMNRVSVIKGSPLYRQQREAKREELHSAIIEKKSDQMVEDPVLKVLQGHKIEAAEKLVDKMSNAKNEFLQAACAKDVLNYVGYTPEKKVTVKTIEVTAQMADRFEAAIKYTETRTRGMAQPEQV